MPRKPFNVAHASPTPVAVPGPHKATFPSESNELNNRLVLPATGFLRQSQVLCFVPISKSTLWRRVQERRFPAPVKLSERVTVWRAEDIGRWIERAGGPS